MPDQPAYRLARAVVFATVCLTLTTAGHAYAAHAAVPPATVALGFGLVLGLSALLAGTERSFRTILGGLLGAQFGLHALFTQATAGSAHEAHNAHPAAIPHGGTAMPLAHLLAALGAAWWLRRGEAATWSLARRLKAAADTALPRLLSPAPATQPPRPPTGPFPSATPPTPTALRHSLTRRGPPDRADLALSALSGCSGGR
ncbi:hypothetical protein J4573_06295 [Actinomadura barringtoniae]|uniref:MFS transporter n=1 Tax=Actinomadura barringtoniae TaxID=1427535 RepID=A0A939T3H8_9ACTN|nr:hypothetical protein [Actinomadura barringtoniae]MBO2446694.1 hypothetical protein [Actinomadura barringtoniae]